MVTPTPRLDSDRQVEDLVVLVLDFRGTRFVLSCVDEDCDESDDVIGFAAEVEGYILEEAKLTVASKWFDDGWRPVYEEYATIVGAYCPSCAKKYR